MRGFTLLELLVALAIFAVVAALAWGGLDTLARSRRVLDAESERLAQLQRGFGRFERDLRQALPRAARSEGAGHGAALTGSVEGLEVTVWRPSGGWSVSGPDLQRVAWRCADDGLRRVRWAAVDRTPATPRSEALLIPGARDCQWRYFPERGPASEVWPPRGRSEALPRAVELRLSRATDAGGVEEFRRLIELPQLPEPP